MLKVTECNILNSRNLKAVKGIYPYDYIKTDTDFSEINRIMSETSLPSHPDFYSKLKQEALLYTDYKKAHSNWSEWGCKTILDYTMKYLEIDVCILADAFANFRKLFLEYYQIDPCYTVSTPGFTWLAGMRYTKVSLKYYKQETKDILDFFKHGVRGGVSSILGNRIVECNNPVVNPLHSLFRKFTKEESAAILEHLKRDPDVRLVEEYHNKNYLVYLDAISLYSMPMCKPLPTGEMK